MSLSSIAIVQTEKASRYLQQLCKHFGHKVETNFTPEHGQIKLPMGNCSLDAASGTQLKISVDAADKPSLEKTKKVIADHLKRFAFREDPTIEWSK